MTNFTYFDQTGSLDEYDVLITIIAYFNVYNAKEVASLLFIEEDEFALILSYHKDHKDVKPFIDEALLNKDKFFKDFLDFLGEDFINKKKICEMLKI
jgi:hypothetical protein